MEEGNFNLSNLNVVACQIACEIVEEQVTVSKIEKPLQLQDEEARFSWADDSVHVACNDLQEIKSEEFSDISNSHSAIEEDQNYDPLIDQKLKSQQLVTPTFQEHPSPSDDLSTPYKEIDTLPDSYYKNMCSERFVINPDSSSSDEDGEGMCQKSDDVEADLETTNSKITEEASDKNEQKSDTEEEQKAARSCEYGQKSIAEGQQTTAQQSDEVLNDLGSATEKPADNSEIHVPCETFQQNIYPELSSSCENNQSFQTTDNGQCIESGATCYVYQTYQGFTTESSGNMVYFQMPCCNPHFINGSYYYIPQENSVVMNENLENQQFVSVTDESLSTNQNTTEIKETLQNSDTLQAENQSNTPFEGVLKEETSEVCQNEEINNEGEKQSDNWDNFTELSDCPQTDSYCSEFAYQFPSYGDPDGGLTPFNPYQTLQQPLFATDIYQPFTDPVRLNTNFQYPAVYVSQFGLITVLLKHDVSVEMTIDRAIRLVSHQKNLVIASSAKGDKNFIVHPAGKISHDASEVEADIYLKRRVKMSDEAIIFGNANTSYRFNNDKIKEEQKPNFSKLSKNSSVGILFASDKSPDKNLVMSCMDLVANAQYHPIRHVSGGYVVKINQIKVIQNGNGDVKLVCPDKYMRLSSVREDLLLRSKHYIEMGIEPDWSIWVNHGKNFMRANRLGLVLCNSCIEAGFDARDCVRACRIPSGIPIFVGEESFLPKRRYVPRARQKSSKEFD
ncbi:uncharacterized protein LOC134255746 [Saccostrea cucullata]|uniref:uncharacterized protein LOC134255746 n=1 Tax=Saccostrea cuccullata TaxID=36930 RepID=UPI002ED2929D